MIIEKLQVTGRPDELDQSSISGNPCNPSQCVAPCHLPEPPGPPDQGQGSGADHGSDGDHRDPKHEGQSTDHSVHVIAQGSIRGWRSSASVGRNTIRLNQCQDRNNILVKPHSVIPILSGKQLLLHKPPHNCKEAGGECLIKSVESSIDLGVGDNDGRR